MAFGVRTLPANSKLASYMAGINPWQIDEISVSLICQLQNFLLQSDFSYFSNLIQDKNNTKVGRKFAPCWFSKIQQEKNLKGNLHFIGWVFFKSQREFIYFSSFLCDEIKVDEHSMLCHSIKILQKGGFCVIGYSNNNNNQRH